MKSAILTAASLVTTIAISGGAFAQASGTMAPPNTGVPVAAPQSFGSTPAYPPPSNPTPAGYHYVWTYGYDRHGDYLGHWELARDR